MTVDGADPEQLRLAAKQLTQAADQLQGSVKSLGSVISNASFWRGPDSDRFRSQWHGQSVRSITNTVDALHNAANILRRNADEQDTASKADGGGTGGVSKAASVCYNRAPKGLNGIWKEVGETPNGGDMSGYRVQKVVDGQGHERYIVYIGGTTLNPFDHQSWGANIDAISGKPDEAQLKALQRLIPKGAEVMLVGYSQGGIDAQNIAASHALNVQQIVTYGSPVRNDLNVSAVHLQYGQDIVPSSSAVRPDLWSNSASDANNNVEVFASKPSLFTVFGAGEHMSGYGDLSQKWDDAANSGADSRAAGSAEALQKFQGDVVDQVDLKNDGSGNW